jgi:hypothetical protein
VQAVFRDEGHPDVSLSEWTAFRKGFSPYLFETVQDREDGFVANRIVPLARGRAVASRAFLRKAGYRAGMRPRQGWRKTIAGNLTRDIDEEYHLLIRQLPDQKVWTIEHHAYTSGAFRKILVFLFGSTPVVAGTPEAATYIADFCFDNVPAGFRWIKSVPSEYHAARRRALERYRSELAAQLLVERARRFPPGRRAAHLARLAAIEARKKVQG